MHQLRHFCCVYQAIYPFTLAKDIYWNKSGIEEVHVTTFLTRTFIMLKSPRLSVMQKERQKTLTQLVEIIDSCINNFPAN